MCSRARAVSSCLVSMQDGSRFSWQCTVDVLVCRCALVPDYRRSSFLVSRVMFSYGCSTVRLFSFWCQRIGCDVHYPRVGANVHAEATRVVSARSGVWTILFGAGFVLRVRGWMIEAACRK